MKELMIATKNKGKVNEFKELFSSRGINVKSLLDYPEIDDIEETGSTFAENAIIKAEAISKLLKLPVIADDSGLSIDYLDGRPGVYSARYAGEQKNDLANTAMVLVELKDVPSEKRTARFHCALAIAIPEEKTYVVEGTCEGQITEAPRGENGFGYDPVFYVVEEGKTMAELPKDVKNKISHRAKALVKMDKLLNELEVSGK
ncbi:XTP/dITP diphosphatase [Fredinandcohnia quinoae]|uniref:dITP/XTP pyrophosphatase n=1 Tax=Fredinandcohnia quinoae TaxID=2918902 RepID=A0AAW5EC29_9BACI|nr:XTP/dITP diphosphatase [Fredinandcohnia sp. SECRCQ15]MCH1627606.1 XTP/dITP diphosphatase [Fredinandcohnia sp. SECRCQ15]